MKKPPPSLEGLRRAIEGKPMLGVEPILGIASTYLAARYVGAWAAGLVSGLWALAISLSWSRWAVSLNEAVLYFSQQSWTDDLTGLGNDRIFRDRLNLFSREATFRPLSLILIDVDYFKSYNDTYGHPAGDEVLRAIGSILRANALETILKHRLGGDEFAVLLTETEIEPARTIAERLRTAIQTHPWPLRPITASFGVATTSDDASDPFNLLSRADRALYRSKEQGRNRVTDQTSEIPSAG
jgi:diguanylate cyclase (GGDEF)-like protein